ncbi:EXPA9 [Linum perenne]
MKLATILLLIWSLTVLLLSDFYSVRAEDADDSAGHALGRHSELQSHQHRRGRRPRLPPFRSGPWQRAHATFYEGNTRTYGTNELINNTGGACDYTDVVGEGYGMNTAALSNALFRDGKSCGACFQIQCIDDPQWCKPGHQSLFVTATDLCDNGGWCNPPREHFDIAMPVFNHLAEYKAGIIPVKYRRVPCRKSGGIRYTMMGNQWFYEVIVSNVGGSGDIVAVHVKVDQKPRWIPLDHDWGATWKTGFPLQGKSLSFRVRGSDGRYSTSPHVVPNYWQFGQTFEGKNFKSKSGRRKKDFGQV